MAMKDPLYLCRLCAHVGEADRLSEAQAPAKVQLSKACLTVCLSRHTLQTASAMALLPPDRKLSRTTIQQFLLCAGVMQAHADTTRWHERVIQLTTRHKSVDKQEYDRVSQLLKDTQAEMATAKAAAEEQAQGHAGKSAGMELQLRKVLSPPNLTKNGPTQCGMPARTLFVNGKFAGSVLFQHCLWTAMA